MAAFGRLRYSSVSSPYQVRFFGLKKNLNSNFPTVNFKDLTLSGRRPKARLSRIFYFFTYKLSFMILNSIVIGKAKKSAGNLTVQNWKGLTVGRQKPTDVANPKTAAQTNRRAMLSTMVKLFRSLSAVINTGFSQLAIQMSAYNAFASYCLKNVQFGDGGTITNATAMGLKIAKGTLPSTDIASAIAQGGGGALEITRAILNHPDALPTDQLFAAVINQDGVVKFSGNTGATRANPTKVINPLNNQVFDLGDYVYTFYYQPATRKVSDSVVVVVE